MVNGVPWEVLRPKTLGACGPQGVCVKVLLQYKCFWQTWVKPGAALQTPLSFIN